MMEFEDEAEDHEEEEEEEAIEAEDDEEDDHTELFPNSHPHPSSTFNNDSASRVANSVISPTPLALKMSSNPETPPLLQPVKNHHNSRGGQPSSARYKECLKNHAVGIGGHAVDGCGEFMPAGPDGSLDALKCAACNCHRNFHRKEFTDPAPPLPEKPTAAIYPYPHIHPPHIHQHHPPPPQVFQFYPYNRTPGGPGGGGFLQLPAPPQRPPPPPPSQPQPLALPSTTATSSGDGEDISPCGMISPGSSGGMMMSKKRFRTKFTAEQKERMLELAERMGWRLQKQDEAMIQRFCEENGVRRQVLKVWMHNNKNTLGGISSSGGGVGGGVGGDSSGGGKKP